jgi:hypothetical protein
MYNINRIVVVGQSINNDMLYVVTTSIKHFFSPVHELWHIPKTTLFVTANSLIIIYNLPNYSISRDALLQKCVFWRN